MADIPKSSKSPLKVPQSPQKVPDKPHFMDICKTSFICCVIVYNSMLLCNITVFDVYL